MSQSDQTMSQLVLPNISDKDFDLSEINRIERELKLFSKPPANFTRIGEDEDIVQECINVIQKEKEASVSILNRRLRLGYDRAARIMNELANRGIVGPYKDASKPRDILIHLSSDGYLRGNAQWQTNLGVAYASINKHDEAVVCFAHAARQGNTRAQSNLGICYFNGLGLTINESEAVKWFFRASAQKDANAEYGLGLAYLTGRGVPENHTEAAKWFHEAAMQEHALAQFNLSIVYEKGDGVTQNYIAAYNWAKRAATQGYEDAVAQCAELISKMSPEQIEAVEASKLVAATNEIRALKGNRIAILSEVRREVWRRDEGKCVKCGSREKLEYDHIIPVSKGGSNTARNIELLCENCNRAKSDSIQ